MDFVLCQELLKQTEQLGASDAAIVVENITQRIEKRKNGIRTLHSEKIQRANLHIQLENATFTANLIQGKTGVMARELIHTQIKNGIQAAKLANIWGCAQKVTPLHTAFGQTSAQNCPAPAPKQPEIIGWDEDANPIFKKEKPIQCPPLGKPNACIPQCFQPQCLLEKAPIDAPMLDHLETQNLQIKGLTSTELIQTTSHIDTMIYLQHEVKSQARYETSIAQSAQIQTPDGEKRLSLPKYWFDGLIQEPNTPEHQEMLTFSDIWDDLSASLKATETPNQDIFGVVLSPWVLGVLAHEAKHLGIDLAKSGKMHVNMSKCLYMPPCNHAPCPSFALEHIGNARPTRRLLFARVPSHTLIVDVPTAWVRRKQTELAVQCLMACELSNQTIARRFQPVILRFDLQNMWSYCTEIAEPSRRIALNCGHGYGIVQAPWAYFNMKNIYQNTL